MTKKDFNVGRVLFALGFVLSLIVLMSSVFDGKKLDPFMLVLNLMVEGIGIMIFSLPAIMSTLDFLPMTKRILIEKY